MPNNKVRPKNIIERNLVEEGHLIAEPKKDKVKKAKQRNEQPRNKLGQFTSKNKVDAKYTRKKMDTYKERPIRLKKVKGSYGTFLVKDKSFPEYMQGFVILSIVIFILISMI